MIAKLIGLLDSVADTWLILDVGGVGYRVSCTSRTLSQMPSLGSSITLWIQTLVKENDIQLYGFLSPHEQEWFMVLMTVQGVGARMALAILSALSLQDLAQAIMQQDKISLTRADGVGQKLATRIVTELKDKIHKMNLMPSGMTSSPSIGALQGAQESEPVMTQALSALMNLGYKKGEAYQVLTEAHAVMGSDVSLDALIRKGLSLLSQT